MAETRLVIRSLAGYVPVGQAAEELGAACNCERCSPKTKTRQQGRRAKIQTILGSPRGSEFSAEELEKLSDRDLFDATVVALEDAHAIEQNLPPEPYGDLVGSKRRGGAPRRIHLGPRGPAPPTDHLDEFLPPEPYADLIGSKRAGGAR